MMRHGHVPRIAGSSAVLFSLANVPIMYAAFMDPSLLDPVRRTPTLSDKIQRARLGEKEGERKDGRKEGRKEERRVRDANTL